MSDVITLDSVSLPPGLWWADEFTWTPVEQSKAIYTLGGALVVQYGTRQSGRPVTLQGGADSDPIDRQTLDALRGLLSTPTLTLTMRGTTYTVGWRHEDGPLDASPLIRLHPIDPTDLFCSLVLRLRIL